MKANLPKIFIVFTIVLDAMGIGLILPVMPDLIEAVRGVTLAQAAIWGGVLTSSYAVMQFLCSPTIGNLSDRYGRRPILLASLAVMALDYVIMALAASVWLLLAGRIVAGIAAATQPTAFAFMADITPKEKRAQNFGLISAGFGVGFVLGPVLGGILGDLDPRAPFYAAAALAAMNFVFGLLVLPESLPPARRRSFDWRRANPLGGLKQMRKLPGVTTLLMVNLAYMVSNWVYPSIWAYYTQARFGFDPGMVGISLAVYGISTAIVQAVLIRFILGFLGDVRTVYVFLIWNFVILIVMGFIGEEWMLWVVIPLSALGGVVQPALVGIISRGAGEDQQGEVQGANSSLQAIATIVSPLVMTQIFYLFTREGSALILPGAPFLFSSLLMLASFALFAFSLPRAPAAAQSADGP